MISNVFLFFILCACVSGDDEYPKVTICRGADSISHGRSLQPYKWLLYKFRNCTHITGHLPIVKVKKGAGDLSFLNSIVEVYGGVLIQRNQVEIPLKNLKVIRGYNTQPSSYSLRIYKNSKKVDLRSLRSIVNGNVSIFRNWGDCYINTIDWRLLIENPSKQSMQVTVPPRCQGNPCNATCNGHCWGPTSDLCQKMMNCSADKVTQIGRRCFSQSLCCDVNCIGGCTGYTAKDCVACRSFINVGTCVSHCPKKHITDVTTNKDIENPDFKYTSYLFCRKKCPKHFFIQKSDCKSECHKDFYLNGQKCEKCSNGICPSEHCRLDVLRDQLPADIRKLFLDGTMHRSLIRLLRNCSTLFGNIRLNSASGRVISSHPDEYVRYEDLFNLKNIRSIRGFVHIDLSYFPEATDLSFLASLETIISYESLRGFEIFNGAGLTHLGLTNLTKLVVNAVKIVDNKKLCFLEHFPERFKEGKQYTITSYKDKQNQDYYSCFQQGHICSKACVTGLGCWGPGPSMCVACPKFQVRYAFRRTCVSRCEDETRFYTKPDNATCAPCHPQCATSCFGPRADQCKGGCLNYKDGANCVQACPFTKFANETSRLCLACANVCTNLTDRPSCTGPLPTAGKNGCLRCLKIVAKGPQQKRCFLDQPSEGFYAEDVSVLPLESYEHLKDFVDRKQSRLLFPCDDLCVTCRGPGPSLCDRCREPFYKYSTSTCTRKCPAEGTYADPGPPDAKTNMRSCLPCDDECRRCTNKFNCTICKSHKVYLSADHLSFYCNSTCPLDQPYSDVDEHGESYCVSEQDHFANTRLALSVAVPVFLIVVLVVMSVVSGIYVWKRQARLRLDRDKLRARYTGRLEDDRVQLNVTGVCPNASQLRIIGASRVTKGNEIGAGAFGTVFKGTWRPEPEDPKETLVDVKVAIKELKSHGSKRSTEEFLSEARLMASVDNPYCIKLLGVCMTSELMLVSEFMPLGNLKDYLQRKQSEIGSKRLLHWCIQIAKGMDYLASRDIIHRDLAARNVLLQSEDHLRITDFGLAKLVDHGHEFQDQGQRLPIKWLASECIRSQIFSTKSDVWAFGVTLWEMFTFGEPPYRELQALYLLQHLDSGERLPQPAICTLDLYMLMIKCWLADPISRPTFDELLSELKKMAADPGRYLIIEGDNLRRAPLRSVSTLTASSVEVMQATCAKSTVAAVNFDFSTGKCFDTSSVDSGDLLDCHYVEDPTAVSALPDPMFHGSLHRPPAITEGAEEIDEVFDRGNDYERPLMLKHAVRESEYVAPLDSPEATASPSAYMNVPDTAPLLVSNPTYSAPDSSRRLLDESIEDYPLTPFAPPSQYVNLRF